METNKKMRLSEIILDICLSFRPADITADNIQKYLHDHDIRDLSVENINDMRMSFYIAGQENQRCHIWNFKTFSEYYDENEPFYIKH